MSLWPRCTELWGSWEQGQPPACTGFTVQCGSSTQQSNGVAWLTQVAVKYKNNLGYTPLHLAAKLGNLPVCEVLLGAGARADLKDQVCCCTVMQPCACSHWHAEAKPTCTGGVPTTAIWCRLNGQRCASFLLQRGKLPADLVPRVGNHNELLELLSAAAAEKGGGGASAMGGLSPSVPAQRSSSASPGPHPALSPGLTQTLMSSVEAVWCQRLLTSLGPHDMFRKRHRLRIPVCRAVVEAHSERQGRPRNMPVRVCMSGP